MKSYLVGYHYVGQQPPQESLRGPSGPNVIGIFRAHSPEGAVVEATSRNNRHDADYAYWTTEVTEFESVVTFEERDHS